LLGSATLCGIVQSAAGQSSSQAEVLAALAERDKAFLAGDETQGAVHVRYGRVQDKQQWLNEYYRPMAPLLKSGKTRRATFERSDVVVRDLGDTVVLAGKQNVKLVGIRSWSQNVTIADDSPVHTLRFTQVWMKRGRAFCRVDRMHEVRFSVPRFHIQREMEDANASVRLATFDQYRGLPFSIAYRMLGSVADAEDMLQETFIRWQQASDPEIRSPPRLSDYHYQPALYQLPESARVQREEYVGEWLPEPLVADQSKDPFGMIKIDESLSMAFLVLLERLTPVERAVFLLREVFEYEYSEIATTLGQSEVNCRQILSRARRHVTEMRPRFKASSEQQSNLLDRFLRAIRNADMNGLLELLSQDVTLYSDGGGKGTAVPNQIHGADRVARGIILGFTRFVPKNLTYRLVQVNGNPGVVSYLDGKPFSVMTLDGSEEKIHWNLRDQQS
jgi:RNA polymerase sigma-70 factor (ECF subfamily)